MNVVQGFKFRVHRYDFAIVEVSSPCGGEDSESRIRRLRGPRAQPRTVHQHTRGTLALSREHQCQARASRKACEIGTVVVRREAHTRVLNHGLRRLRPYLPRAVV
jgi:hypothetical protein